MQKLKNQNGFSVLDGILVVIALAAIGAAGYFAYTGHHQKAVTVTKTVSKPATPAQAASPTADWKTYNSTSEPALSFKYPPSWKLTQTNAQGGTYGSGPSGDGVQLTSSNGTIVKYMSQAGGFGGACPPGSKDVIITAVQSLPNVGGLYYVEYKQNDGADAGVIDLPNNNNTAPVTGEDTGSCLFYPLFDSRSAASNQLMLSAETVASADAATVKLVLESLQY